MNYKKEIPNVEWGNARAAKDMFASQYVDQDIQQWPQLPADKMVPGFAAGYSPITATNSMLYSKSRQLFVYAFN